MADEASGGKKLFKDLAAKVRAKNDASGEALVHQRGLAFVEELAKELTGPDGMPGLLLWRDQPHKFRLQRERKNAEISVEWQRNIGALVIACTVMGKEKSLQRYVCDEATKAWRRMDALSEPWEDLSKALVELLYPEAR
jgi:hypothetical protein